MGMLQEPVDFITKIAPRLPPRFSIVELGDQWITCETPHRLARDFWQELGCGKFESIDANGRGTFQWDLNLPLPRDFGEFDVVTDFGTGEHVFNQFQLFKTIHYLCKPGGWIIFDRPAQGYLEHCFWLANECVFKDLAATNNYHIAWFENAATKRGSLFRGAFRKGTQGKFLVPQQGRYKKMLKLDGSLQLEKAKS